MTDEMFRAVLETGGAKDGKDGWATLPDGRLMTLHVAHDGAPLSIAKVDAVKTARNALWARTAKGETFVMSLEDLFAIALDRGNTTAVERKAGFLG